MFQPWVSDYIDSFINNFGLGIFIYFVSLFLIILIGKAFSSSIKWTDLTLDKTFGFFFGVFRGYIVNVFIFTILNWFYPFNNWSIDINNSLTFELVKKVVKFLLMSFLTLKNLRIQRRELRKSDIDKLNEECGIFGISNHEDSSKLVALGLHALQHRGQEGCGIVSYDGKIITQKKSKV